MKSLFQRLWSVVLIPIKRWKLTLLVIVITSAAGYWYISRQNNSKEELTFVSPQMGALVQTLEVPGVISAKEYARMRFAAGGKVVYLGAQEGDTVKKWQTIATIDQRSAQKTLEKELIDYSQERLNWDQTLDNTKDRWLPKSEDRDKQSSQYDLTDTVLDVEIQDIAISNTYLSAPFAGVLVASPTSVTGVNLLSTDIFELVNPETLYFRAEVDELDIGLVDIGQSVDIELDAYPEDILNSQVDYIAYKSEQTSTSTIFFVEIPLFHRDLDTYRIGMNGNAVITIDRKDNTLTVPLDATIERDGQYYVQVRTGESSYEDRAIEIGLETEDNVEVLSGLTVEDEVLLP